MNKVVWGYLKLTRPANLPTAMADILAGCSISGFAILSSSGNFINAPDYPNVVLLIFASIFLYAGGVVLNDVFDLEIDRVERPERPIPKGIVSQKGASVFGACLLISGILISFFVNYLSGDVALILALSILVYNSFSKKFQFLGPFNMGLCRALNLVLGMSVFGEISHWMYGAIPLLYIFAITLISRGEVYGQNKKHIIWAGLLYAVVILAVLMITPDIQRQWIVLFPFLTLFVFLIYSSLIKAYKVNSPENIKKAVVSGVLSIIVLDASITAAFDSWQFGLIVLLLLPLSFILAKIFAVT
ncbi:UbiA-like protein EboC [uncultured Eudoraea sp.]|uniref:UbiA-like protein EboC n=1 Tax=uncultured Eudoraea sp. TaxID=1035614 RepID=UPI00260241BA|nr:UbiA-like protein EboC [uncultured Eudoraea sp.]